MEKKSKRRERESNDYYSDDDDDDGLAVSLQAKRSCRDNSSGASFGSPPTGPSLINMAASTTNATLNTLASSETRVDGLASGTLPAEATGPGISSPFSDALIASPSALTSRKKIKPAHARADNCPVEGEKPPKKPKNPFANIDLINPTPPTINPSAGANTSLAILSTANHTPSSVTMNTSGSSKPPAAMPAASFGPPPNKDVKPTPANSDAITKITPTGATTQQLNSDQNSGDGSFKLSFANTTSNWTTSGMPNGATPTLGHQNALTMANPTRATFQSQPTSTYNGGEPFKFKVPSTKSDGVPTGMPNGATPTPGNPSAFTKVIPSSITTKQPASVQNIGGDAFKFQGASKTTNWTPTGPPIPNGAPPTGPPILGDATMTQANPIASTATITFGATNQPPVSGQNGGSSAFKFQGASKTTNWTTTGPPIPMDATTMQDNPSVFTKVIPSGATAQQPVSGQNCGSSEFKFQVATTSTSGASGAEVPTLAAKTSAPKNPFKKTYFTELMGLANNSVQSKATGRDEAGSKNNIKSGTVTDTPSTTTSTSTRGTEAVAKTIGAKKQMLAAPGAKDSMPSKGVSESNINQEGAFLATAVDFPSASVWSNQLWQPNDAGSPSALLAGPVKTGAATSSIIATGGAHPDSMTTADDFPKSASTTHKTDSEAVEAETVGSDEEEEVTPHGKELVLHAGKDKPAASDGVNQLANNATVHALAVARTLAGMHGVIRNGGAGHSINRCNFGTYNIDRSTTINNITQAVDNDEVLRAVEATHKAVDDCAAKTDVVIAQTSKKATPSSAWKAERAVHDGSSSGRKNLFGATPATTMESVHTTGGSPSTCKFNRRPDSSRGTTTVRSGSEQRSLLRSSAMSSASSTPGISVSPVPTFAVGDRVWFVTDKKGTKQFGTVEGKVNANTFTIKPDGGGPAKNKKVTSLHHADGEVN